MSFPVGFLVTHRRARLTASSERATTAASEAHGITPDAYSAFLARLKESSPDFDQLKTINDTMLQACPPCPANMSEAELRAKLGSRWEAEKADVDWTSCPDGFAIFVEQALAIILDEAASGPVGGAGPAGAIRPDTHWRSSKRISLKNCCSASGRRVFGFQTRFPGRRAQSTKCSLRCATRPRQGWVAERFEHPGQPRPRA